MFNRKLFLANAFLIIEYKTIFTNKIWEKGCYIKVLTNWFIWLTRDQRIQFGVVLQPIGGMFGRKKPSTKQKRLEKMMGGIELKSGQNSD